MDERGWRWNSSEIRQVRLVEWISRQEGDSCRISEFYDSLPDQAMNRWDVAHDDLKRLENRSLILQFFEGGGGIQGMEVLPAPQMRDLAEEIRDKRANRPGRRVACRDAMVAWLWSHDAISPASRQIREEMLKQPRYGTWFAESFSDADLDTAAGWLHRQGLVDGVGTGETDGPVLLFLTDEGAECAERFESDTVRWQQAKQMGTASGMIVNIGGDNHGQVAGDYADQTQNTGASADHLRELIIGLAELVHTLVPNASELAEERQEALAAAADGAVNPSIVRRFVNWALSTVAKGASAAVVPVVTSAANDILREAERLAHHL
jgi:hypothetical protein